MRFHHYSAYQAKFPLMSRFNVQNIFQSFFSRYQYKIPPPYISRHTVDQNTSLQSPNHQPPGVPFQARNSHFLTAHTRDAPHACKSCGRRFKTSARLAEHARGCGKGVRFACGVCGRGFVSARNMAEHCKVVHEKPKGIK